MLVSGECRGCKLGYGPGERDIDKVKCHMKVCCFRDRKLATCADCEGRASCPILAGFFSHQGYNYRKYREALEYIAKNGYDAFIEAARDWKGAYGKLPR